MASLWLVSLLSASLLMALLSLLIPTAAAKPPHSIDYLRQLVTYAIFHSSRSSATLGLILLPLLLSSPFSSRARFYLRMIAFIFGLAVGSLTGVVAGIGVSIVQPSWRKNIQWLVARTFYRIVSPLIGWKFVVEGEEFLEPCYRGKSHVLVGNHQSMIDIFYLGRIFPKTCVVMAKKELKYAPLLGQFMSLSRAVFVDRHNRTTAMETFKKAVVDMQAHGLSLFVFPEGTRSNANSPMLLPFKKGAFHLALQAGLPVIPIVCEIYEPLYNPRKHRFDPGKLTLKVLEPIPTGGVTAYPGEGSVDQLCTEVRRRMLESLVELSKRHGSVSSQTVPAS